MQKIILEEPTLITKEKYQRVSEMQHTVKRQPLLAQIPPPNRQNDADSAVKRQEKSHLVPFHHLPKVLAG